MPTVELPSRNSAIVSFTLRLKWRWMAMKTSVPIGRAMKASAEMAKEYRVPSSRSANGKNTAGKTSTEAMA